MFLGGRGGRGDGGRGGGRGGFVAAGGRGGGGPSVGVARGGGGDDAGAGASDFGKCHARVLNPFHGRISPPPAAAGKRSVDIARFAIIL